MTDRITCPALQMASSSRAKVRQRFSRLTTFCIAWMILPTAFADPRYRIPVPDGFTDVLFAMNSNTVDSEQRALYHRLANGIPIEEGEQLVAMLSRQVREGVHEGLSAIESDDDQATGPQLLNATYGFMRKHEEAQGTPTSRMSIMTDGKFTRMDVVDALGVVGLEMSYLTRKLPNDRQILIMILSTDTHADHYDQMIKSLDSRPLKSNLSGQEK